MTHIDAPNTPRYAFGYCLSCTHFTYTDLHLSDTLITNKDSIAVNYKLTNTGKYAGEEVVQLYLRD